LIVQLLELFWTGLMLLVVKLQNVSACLCMVD